MYLRIYIYIYSNFIDDTHTHTHTIGLNSSTIFVRRHRDLLSDRIPRDQSSLRTIDSSVKNFSPPGPRHRRMNNAHSQTRYTREKSFPSPTLYEKTTPARRDRWSRDGTSPLWRSFFQRGARDVKATPSLQRRIYGNNTTQSAFVMPSPPPLIMARNVGERKFSWPNLINLGLKRRGDAIEILPRSSVRSHSKIYTDNRELLYEVGSSVIVYIHELRFVEMNRFVE